MLLIATLIIVCLQPSVHVALAQTNPEAEVVTPLNLKSLPNAFRLHEKVISGGLPEGKAGFEALKKLGVHTVISVDGAKPEVALAKKYGLRYVHLPHGYDGVPEKRARELAKAVSELPGPIYIHCHHGKHRSPAAATVACIGAGFVPAKNGQEILTRLGTGKDYRGLYQSVEKAVRYQDQQLRQLKVEYPEVAKIPPMAEAMVRLSDCITNLKKIADSAWRIPKDHPNLVPRAEVLLMREQFAELLRTDQVKMETQEFREILQHSLDLSLEMEKVLHSAPPGELPVKAQQRLTELRANVRKDCKLCHGKYRDNLSESERFKKYKEKR